MWKDKFLFCFAISLLGWTHGSLTNPAQTFYMLLKWVFILNWFENIKENKCVDEAENMDSKEL